MIFSMTGFSSKIFSLSDQEDPTKGPKDLCLTISLKSLNSRFFEFNCKIPFWLSSIETDLIKHIKSNLYRGNVFLSIYAPNGNTIVTGVEPSIPIISNYLRAIDQIKTSFNIEGSIALKDILALPNIFEAKEFAPNQEIINKVTAEIDLLVKALVESRKSEGLFIEKDLKGRLKIIKSLLKQLEEKAAQFFSEKKSLLAKKAEKLKEEIQALTNLDQNFFQNLTAYNQLDKIDIHEEITRFDYGIKNLTSLLNSKDIQKGKKIDFIIQELFREINTVSSKSSDAEINRLAIDIKVELEKIREQAQNIL